MSRKEIEAREDTWVEAFNGGDAAGTQADAGKFIEIWTRQPDGSWLISDDIFNSDLPAPSA